jgi:hypothetical protein
VSQADVGQTLDNTPEHWLGLGSRNETNTTERVRLDCFNWQTSHCKAFGYWAPSAGHWSALVLVELEKYAVKKRTVHWMAWKTAEYKLQLFTLHYGACYVLPVLPPLNSSQARSRSES